MLLLLPLVAHATDPVFEMDFALDDHLVTDVVCIAQEGPPNGALAIARSPLGWAHEQRLAIHGGHYPESPDREKLMAWLPVDVEPVDEPVGFDLSVAQAPMKGDWLVQVEAKAYTRKPVLAPNFTIVVDISSSMTTVHERQLPVLQDEPGPVYRAVTRLQLVREALKELFEQAPEYARVSIIAMDALQARALLAPVELRQKQLVYEALAKLEPGVVRPWDRETPKVLERISDLTFDQCHDNKVVLFTDHVDQLVQRKAVQDVSRWAQDDVEVWSFGVGLNDDVEADIALLGQAAGGASWLLNSRSDFEEVWRHILDPGGIVASDVYVQVDFPAGSEWKDITEGTGVQTGPARFSVGSMHSGEGWARVFEVDVPDGASPDELSATLVHERDTQLHRLDLEEGVPPFAWAKGSLRTRALGAYWVNDPDVRTIYRMGDLMPHEGVASELRAWFEHLRVRRLGGDHRRPLFEEYEGPNVELPKEEFHYENTKKKEGDCVENAVDIPLLSGNARCD